VTEPEDRAESLVADADEANPKSLAAALQDVLAIVSHDMRTPLSVIQTTTSMLLNPKYQLTAAQIREQHERIKRNAEMLNRLISEVVDLADLRAGKLAIDRQPIVINDVLREAVTACEVAAREKGLALSYDPGTEVMRAEADRARLIQLFQTLIGSAVQSCKSGHRIAVSSRMQGHQALIEISDTGPGIAPEDQPHVFDPFYPATREHRKTGTRLGLYIGKGIVEAHGGQIRCNSQPEAGTTFSIELPLAS
jgi:two-component system, sensor histidine kinase and response regulator